MLQDASSFAQNLFPGRSRTLTASSAALPLFMGQPVLAPTRLSGCEHLCSLFEYSLELKSPEDLLYSPSMASNFPLEDMNGREISVCIELDGKGPSALGSGTRQINALITQARYLRPEGRHHVYGLTLRPWLWLATLNQTCRVFQDQTVVQILDAILGFYPFPVDQRLSKTDYPSRDYQVQYNESDYDFIARLCEEWGIAWWFEHSNGAHRLVLADGMGAFNANPSAAYGSVSFYPPGHKTDEEYVSALRVADSLTSTAWASTDTDYTRERADLKVLAQSDRALPEASSEVPSQHMGEVFSYPLDSAQPKAGAGGLSAAGNEAMDEGALFARVRLQALQAHTHRAYGHGNLRGMVTGCSFKLLKHPQERANIEWLILGTELEIEEIAQESQGSASLLGVNVPAQEWRCAVDFTVQPTALAYRPPLTRTKPLVHGWQRAVVTGPEDKELWTDAYGRVKVVFPWDRDNPRHGEGGGADHTSSCWLRVVSPWAGSQYGAIHIPRVGQEVVVGFENGDPDRPLITGRVVNNANLPPWSLPENQSLSGIRSKELYGAQHNHLVFDDTQGEVQAQLNEDSRVMGAGMGAGADTRMDEAFVKLQEAVNAQPNRKTLRISIFGFSRGAAIARMFANRLDKKIKAGQFGKKTVTIEFMGLFDTVASFGLPALHLKADDLVIPASVKKCVHMVAVHEFRISFPVWTIRTAPGYDSNGYEEYVYPGVHTDVGGGYGPKGFGSVEDHHWVSNNISVIPLRHMYTKAIASGVPLASIEEVLETPVYKNLFAATTAEGEVDTLALKAYNNYVNKVQASGALERHMVEHHRVLCRWWGWRNKSGIGNVEPLLKPYQQSVDEAQRTRNQPHLIGVSAEAQRKERLIRQQEDYQLQLAKLRLEAKKKGMAYTTDLIREEANELKDRDDNLFMDKLDQDELTRFRAYQAADPAEDAKTLLDDYLHDSVQWFDQENATKYLVYRYFRVRGVHDGEW